MVEISAESPRSAAISLTGRLGFHFRRPSKPPSRKLSTIAVNRRRPPPLPRVELGIHGLNRWTVKCLEMSRKCGVHAARNGPSEDRKSWQHIEPDIHGLKSWGRNWSRKVRETRSSSDVQGHEGGRRPPTFGRPGSVVGPQRPRRRWSPAPRPLPPSGNGFVFRLDSALVRPKSQYVND